VGGRSCRDRRRPRPDRRSAPTPRRSSHRGPCARRSPIVSVHEPCPISFRAAGHDRTRTASPRLQSWVKGLSVAGWRSHPDGCRTRQIRCRCRPRTKGGTAGQYRANRGRAGRGSALSLLAQSGTASMSEPSGASREALGIPRLQSWEGRQRSEQHGVDVPAHGIAGEHDSRAGLVRLREPHLTSSWDGSHGSR